MSPYILLFIGLLMIFIEFYLPGGVLGTAGVLIVIGSIVLYAVQSTSLIGSIIFTVIAIVAVAILVKLALKRIQKTKEKKTLYSEDDQEGFYASSYDRTAIGKTGVVSTDLRPGGHIVIDGKSHLAISQSGYILKGEEVIVMRGEGESLIVRTKKKDTV